MAYRHADQDDQERLAGILKWTDRRGNREGFWSGREARWASWSEPGGGGARIAPLPAPAAIAFAAAAVASGYVRQAGDGAPGFADVFDGSRVQDGVMGARHAMRASHLEDRSQTANPTKADLCHIAALTDLYFFVGQAGTAESTPDAIIFPGVSEWAAKSLLADSKARSPRWLLPKIP